MYFNVELCLFFQCKEILNGTGMSQKHKEHEEKSVL